MRLRLWCQATRQETEAILTGLPNRNYCQHRLWSVINNYLDYTRVAPHKHRGSELHMSFSARLPHEGRPGLASDGLAVLQEDKLSVCTPSGDLLGLHLKIPRASLQPSARSLGVNRLLQKIDASLQPCNGMRRLSVTQLRIAHVREVHVVPLFRRQMFSSHPQEANKTNSRASYKMIPP